MRTFDMKLEPIGRFWYGDVHLYIEGVGHRMEDIVAMGPEQYIKVFCTDGNWYSIKKKDIRFYYDYSKQVTQNENKEDYSDDI